MDWLPVDASWLDQMEIWFSSLQRKLLQTNHLEGSGKLKQAIVDFTAHSNEAAEFTEWSCTVLELGQRRGGD